MKGKPTVGRPVDVARCIELYNSGLSIGETGRRMGHHHSVIAYHLKRNGVIIRSQREAQRKKIKTQDIADMYASGMSAPEIAAKLGITYQCVYDRLAEIGMKTRSRREQIKVMIERGTYNVPCGEKNKLWRGGTTIDEYGYRHINIGGKYILEHRLIWEKERGPIPDGFVVHHLNGDKIDNRIENLIALPRKCHSPKTITEPYKQRIRELEAELVAIKQTIELDKRV